jgi:acetoin:2,6-dichlorophenolindophenol oxidoreductase subunit beta
MTRQISFKQAINEAMAQEMARDESVIAMGEDIAGGKGGEGEVEAWGGVLGATKGLYKKFGDRIMDTPISESAYVGAAVGAAACGLRPVAELMFVDFLGVCFDQIFNQAAKFRYMFGGKAVTPVVIRTMFGAGFRAAAQHSQCLYSIFTHIPGLKCVVPSTPYDAKGLLIQAIRDNDPVITSSTSCCTAWKVRCPRRASPFLSARRTLSATATTSPSWRLAGWCTLRRRPQRIWRKRVSNVK